MSVIIFVVLLLGIFGGMIIPEAMSAWLATASNPMLLLLLFSVGIDIGSNTEVFVQIRQLGVRVLLIPVGVIVGSLVGGACAAMVVGAGVKEGLAIASGLGWYSLAGVLITDAGYPIAGAISFLSNIFREIIAFIVVPIVAKYLNDYTAIAPGGATTMDTTLGVVRNNTNAKTAVLAFMSGSICTLIVPILVPLFL